MIERFCGPTSKMIKRAYIRLSSPSPALVGRTFAASRCSDALPDEVATALGAFKQHRARAHRQSIPRELDQTLLVDPDPVGEQAELHLVDDRVPAELLAAAIAHVGLGGVHLLLCARPGEISGGELRAVGTHHGHEHVAVSGVGDVPYGILPEPVADPTIEAPVLPR